MLLRVLVVHDNVLIPTDSLSNIIYGTDFQTKHSSTTDNSAELVEHVQFDEEEETSALKESQLEFELS